MNNFKRTGKAMSKKILCLLAISLIYSSFGYGYESKSEGIVENQQVKITVQGKVVDSKNEPLIGVSVAVKGTSVGTLTDVDGAYSITVPSGAALTFSYVGYKTQTIVVGNRKTINVTMEESSQMLNEMVVVGYGVQKKTNLTGAVASVDVEKTLDSRPISDVGRDLQGSVPGLSIVVPSG
jgi:hypothetical protein